MEIKRQIIESNLPPENKNVWWFDLNEKKLKRYTGNSWTLVDVSYLPIEPTETINTTYAKAKALYEAGEMKPGVYYKFDYYHWHPAIEFSESESGYRPLEITIPILVYLDQYGNLKAKGELITDYGSSPCESITFTSDYTFDIKALAVEILDEIYDYIPIQSHYTLLPENYGFGVESFIHDLEASDIEFDTFDYEGTISIIFKDVAVFVAGSPIIIQSTKWRIELSDDEYRIDFINVQETGLLFNLDFGNFKHSYLVYNTDTTEGAVSFFKGDIDIKLDQFVFINSDSEYGNTIGTGFIKNSNVLIYSSDDYISIVAINSDVYDDMGNNWFTVINDLWLYSESD